MPTKTYTLERDGQMAFFRQYGLTYNTDGYLEASLNDVDELVLADNNDGVFNGILFEFKLSTKSTLDSTLHQAIRYCSYRRVTGKPVPAKILLVYLNQHKAYLYESKDYFAEIHKTYQGAASKGNNDFVAHSTPVEYDYSNPVDSGKVRKLLHAKRDRAAKWMPVMLDANSIVCWADRYYQQRPKASKGDFMGDDDQLASAITLKGEIREPTVFKDLIKPYDKPTNKEFARVMDCLNDRLSKKELGAFFTPEPYCKKAAELVMKAIERVPDGNDYVIIDRCAGTGNLERALDGLKDHNGSDVIGHCIVSTYEYWEYKVLDALFGSKVRLIVPPTEADVDYDAGRVKNADAMSEEYIDNVDIMRYVNEGWDDDTGHHDLTEWPYYEGSNGHCTIILFENPPYQDSSAITFVEDDNTSQDDNQKRRKKTKRKTSFIAQQFSAKAMTYIREKRGASREISNLFIWSGFEYYLRQDTDSYVVFSPVKYFKNIGLVQKKFLDGFVFNRRYFHATDSVISCCLWSYESDTSTKSWSLSVFDIIDDKCVPVSSQNSLVINAVYKGLSELYGVRTMPGDTSSSIVCASDGKPIIGWSHKTKTAIYNENIIAYMACNGWTSDPKHRYLTRCGYKTGIEQSFGFMVRSFDYLNKLPLWVAKMFPQDEWYEKDVYNTTADGGDAYTHDREFLKRCLIYACLSNQNKCLSFHGSDGRDYQNELCFDNSASKDDDKPLAWRDLQAFITDPKTKLDDDEKELIACWNEVLTQAKACRGTHRLGSGVYDDKWYYGVYQIGMELNTSYKVGVGRKVTTEYDYPKLNSALIVLRDKLKAYYKSHITQLMFKYELLK